MSVPSTFFRCSVPEPRELRRFVSRPPPGGSRLHCTMLRHAVEPMPCYTLYLEYLGGLVPLLKGRRISKIRPEFVIFDPQNQEMTHMFDEASQCPSFSDGSDTERDTADLCGSPRNRKKSRRRREEKGSDEIDDLTYADTLPEVKWFPISCVTWKRKSQHLTRFQRTLELKTEGRLFIFQGVSVYVSFNSRVSLDLMNCTALVNSANSLPNISRRTLFA